MLCAKAVVADILAVALQEVSLQRWVFCPAGMQLPVFGGFLAASKQLLAGHFGFESRREIVMPCTGNSH